MITVQLSRKIVDVKLFGSLKSEGQFFWRVIKVRSRKPNNQGPGAKSKIF